MKRSTKAWLAVACAAVLLPLAGCNDGDVTDVPVDQAVEAGVNQALTTTVVPLVQFMGAIGDLLTAPIAPRAAAGLACPDTTGWCNVGSVTCDPGATGLDFDFNECRVVTGDAPVVIDGPVTVSGGSPIFLTLANVHINDSPAITGQGAIDVNACDYSVNVTTSDATVVGTLTQCDADPYPKGDVVNIGFSGYLVTVTLDGDNSAPAVATQDETPVASCTINLDTLTSSCDAL